MAPRTPSWTDLNQTDRQSDMTRIVVLILTSLCLTPAFASDMADRDARALSGGANGTTFTVSRHAFGRSLPALPIDKLRDFAGGNRIFNTNWVEAPASVNTLDGLGPVFNRVSCSGCHTRDGRGQPPASPDAPMLSMLVRLSVPGKDAQGGPKPHPRYGDQLNDRAIRGVPPEGRVSVSYTEVEGRYADGERYTLRKPVYRFVDMNFGELEDGVMFSPRIAPAVFGLGLLEAVPEKTIVALADPDDADGDGVSGRPNQVWDHINGRKTLGRFGLKANQPSLRQQNAGAALGDIGITTSLFRKQNVAPGQDAAAKAVHGGDPEMGDDDLNRLTFYTRSLSVPARRDVDDSVVQRGEKLFDSIGCAKCHTPTLRTGPSADVPQLANQTIHPYTDLLLHDMGDELADGRPDFEATGREWRTPPLWGIGLVKMVNGHTTLLHDGRARDLAEAILWHGGEGEASREAFRKLPKADRRALIRFLESL